MSRPSPASTPASASPTGTRCGSRPDGLRGEHPLERLVVHEEGAVAVGDAAAATSYPGKDVLDLGAHLQHLAEHEPVVFKTSAARRPRRRPGSARDRLPVDVRHLRGSGDPARRAGPRRRDRAGTGIGRHRPGARAAHPAARPGTGEDHVHRGHRSRLAPLRARPDRRAAPGSLGAHPALRQPRTRRCWVNRLRADELVVCERDADGASRIPAIAAEDVRSMERGAPRRAGARRAVVQPAPWVGSLRREDPGGGP